MALKIAYTSSLRQNRFYSMAVERDLFGYVILVRRWGRLGSAGKTRLDEHRGESEAMAALQALQSAKRKKGYQPIMQNTYEVG
jgi:predicted DNA-binding WGR domain protein